MYKHGMFNTRVPKVSSICSDKRIVNTIPQIFGRSLCRANVFYFF